MTSPFRFPMARLAFVLTLALLVSACGGGSSSLVQIAIADSWHYAPEDRPSIAGPALQKRLEDAGIQVYNTECYSVSNAAYDTLEANSISVPYRFLSMIWVYTIAESDLGKFVPEASGVLVLPNVEGNARYGRYDPEYTRLFDKGCADWSPTSTTQ